VYQQSFTGAAEGAFEWSTLISTTLCTVTSPRSELFSGPMWNPVRSLDRLPEIRVGFENACVRGSLLLIPPTRSRWSVLLWPGKVCLPTPLPTETWKKESCRRKTCRKIVVAAMTETTRAKGSAMMFITGFRVKAAKMVWRRLAPNAAKK